jgi:alpha-ketoglutarate-dependent taurine dioxygenase
MNTTLTDMNSQHLSPRMWDAQALRATNEWQLKLTKDVIDEFIRQFPDMPSCPEEYTFIKYNFPELQILANKIKNVLFQGHGVCLVKGLADSSLTVEQQRYYFAVLGMALGTPLTHYGLLYPIKDRGVDYRTQALPVSMTCAETEFHTDSSSVDANPDILSLLCENPSNNGGESQVSNALPIYHRLKEEAPEKLAILENNFIRDIVTPGKEATLDNLKQNSFPIFTPQDNECEMQFRYMRYWIARGKERVGESLTEAEVDALDTLDDLLKNHKYKFSFHLQKGDMIYFNNKMVAHNRTAYEDTPDNRRLLWRMWIALTE